MLGKALRWLARTMGHRSQNDDESEGRRFVPSRLDFSVRSSHGGGNAEGARELEQITTKAEMLEEEQHDR
jgi:hypothetical protein